MISFENVPLYKMNQYHKFTNSNFWCLLHDFPQSISSKNKILILSSTLISTCTRYFTALDRHSLIYMRVHWENHLYIDPIPLQKIMHPAKTRRWGDCIYSTQLIPTQTNGRRSYKCIIILSVVYGSRWLLKHSRRTTGLYQVMECGCVMCS